MGGVSYYIGELNPTGHFKPDFMHPAGGIYIRSNPGLRWCYRANVFYGKVSGNDAFSKSESIRNRNLSFYSELWEFSGQIEFNFMPFNVLDNSSVFSPYIFIGLGAFLYNPIGELNGNEYELRPLRTEGQVEPYGRAALAIPFGTGIKVKFTDRISAHIEWGVRRTNTDYLDDVSTIYPYPQDLGIIAAGLSNKAIDPNGPGKHDWGTQRGNSKNNDWYSVAGIGLTFRISKNYNLCYFNPNY
jgi:hypothetical protein